MVFGAGAAPVASVPRFVCASTSIGVFDARESEAGTREGNGRVVEFRWLEEK
jgi:hypothetical protein